MKAFYYFFVLTLIASCNSFEKKSKSKDSENKISDPLLYSLVDSKSFFDSIPEFLGNNSYKIKNIDSLMVSGTMFYAINIINESEKNKISKALLISRNKDVLFDSNFILNECGVSTYLINNIEYSKEILYEDLVVLELQESTYVCCGSTDKKIISRLYFDSKSTNKLFEYEKYYLNLDNDVCEDTIIIPFGRETTALFLDGGFIQLHTKYSSNGKLDSTRSKNIMFTD